MKETQCVNEKGSIDLFKWVNHEYGSRIHIALNVFPCLFLRFATREPNGLLLYNGRFNEKHDFIAMEIIEEQIQLTYSAGRIVIRRNRFGITFSFRCAEFFCPFDYFSGETKTTVSPHIAGGVSDGQWHVVEVHYYNKV